MQQSAAGFSGFSGFLLTLLFFAAAALITLPPPPPLSIQHTRRATCPLMSAMKRAVWGGITLGVAGAALCLYGDRQVQKVLEAKTPAPATLKALCYVGPRGKPCGGTDAGEGGAVSGIVSFEDDGEECRISYRITGLTPGKHGFHIHEKADFSNGCVSAGPHFNPHGVAHGGPGGDESSRHVGDLGNIEADEEGVAEGSLTDSLVKLSGECSVLGRSVMVHADADDLGQGGHELSATTGNAGARVACGEISQRHY